MEHVEHAIAYTV